MCLRNAKESVGQNTVSVLGLFYGLEYVISIRLAMAVFLMLKALCLHLERYYATDSRSG